MTSRGPQGQKASSGELVTFVPSSKSSPKALRKGLTSGRTDALFTARPLAGRT